MSEDTTTSPHQSITWRLSSSGLSGHMPFPIQSTVCATKGSSIMYLILVRISFSWNLPSLVTNRIKTAVAVDRVDSPLNKLNMYKIELEDFQVLLIIIPKVSANSINNIAS